MTWWRYPKRRQAWGQCQTCGFDKPVSELRLHKRYGWQCITGAKCWDGGPHRDESFAAVNFPEGEGVRKSPASVTNTDTEGI